MNANIKRTPRRRKDVLPLSGANAEGETGVTSPSHSTPQPSPKSGEANAAQETGLAAECSSPAPGSDVDTNSVPSAAGHLSAAPSNEGAESAAVGAESTAESPVRTALAVVSAQVDAIQAMDIRVDELEARYGGVIFQVDTAAGMADAKKAREEIRESRYTLQNLLRDGKVPLNNLKRHMEETTTQRIDRLFGVETPIDSQIKDQEQRKAEEKRQKDLADQRRKDAIEARIEEIRNRAAEAVGKSSADIDALIEQTIAIAIDDTFAEFKSKAESVQKMTLDKLRYFRDSAVAAEEQALELARAQERLESERAAQRLRERRMEAINDINGLIVVAARRRTLAAYEDFIQELERREITEAEFGGDLLNTATAARHNTLVALKRDRNTLATQLEQEAEADRERVRLAQDRARIDEENRQAQLKREAEQREHQDTLRRQREQSEAEDAERKRLLREQEEQTALNSDRMSEIQGIQQQTIIAVSGRAGVRQGGTIQCIRETLAETEAWPVTEERFGPLLMIAQSAKEMALRDIRKLLADEETAEVERQQEATRLQQEAVAKPSDPVEATETENITLVIAEASNRPSDEEIISVVAQAFDVSAPVAAGWIADMAVCQKQR